MNEPTLSPKLMPLRIFRLPSLRAVNLIVLLLYAPFFAMSFFLSLYMHAALGYGAIRIGLALMPMAIGAAVSASFVPRIVGRFGPRVVLIIALLSGTGGLAQSGLASGLINTARMLGGALGLAGLTTIATSHTNSELASGVGGMAALADGYQLAFTVGAAICLLAALLAAVLVRTSLHTTRASHSGNGGGTDRDPIARTVIVEARGHSTAAEPQHSPIRKSRQCNSS